MRFSGGCHCCGVTPDVNCYGCTGSVPSPGDLTLSWSLSGGASGSTTANYDAGSALWHAYLGTAVTGCSFPYCVLLSNVPGGPCDWAVKSADGSSSGNNCGATGSTVFDAANIGPGNVIACPPTFHVSVVTGPLASCGGQTLSLDWTQ